MKKIFAILISLLFVVSVFGVAQTMAAVEKPSYCFTEYYKISSDSAKVGETFTISLKKDAMGDVKIQGKNVSEITIGIVANGGLPYRIGNVELIDVDYYNCDWELIHNGLVLPPELNLPGYPHWSELNPSWDQVTWITWTFRAVSPGAMNAENKSCGDTVTVTILSKDLPFKFFAKLFGFGKEK
jgi:hypothetical protein